MADIQDELARLFTAGHHLIPMKADKKPAVRWRHGATDYVHTQPSWERITRWSKTYVAGWASLGGGPGRRVIIDVEAAGAGILELTELLAPIGGRRPTPSGGFHCWLTVTDAPDPFPYGNSKLAYRDGELLAEMRGEGGYAVIIGPGRPDLPTDFEEMKVSTAELDELLERIRALSDTEPTPPPKRGRGRPKGTRQAPPDWDTPPADTGDVLFRAVAGGELDILELLDPGWSEVGTDADGRRHLLRPDYGSPSTAETSGNELHGVTIIHSSSVPWAETQKGYTPAQVLAESRFDGDHAAAMRWVENMAKVAAVTGVAEPGWPPEVLAAVNEVNGRPPRAQYAPTELEAVHDVYRKWLGPKFDTDALDVVLAVAAAEQLDGDGVWLLIVAGSSTGKTEMLNPLRSAPFAHSTSTIQSEGALLAGMAPKGKGATGGLLREMGPRGLLLLKDVTSILSMGRDARGQVLAALREVYDGRWVRTIGVDGGKTVTWEGRIGVIGAVTTSWDGHREVIAAMGDRFLLVRPRWDADAAGEQSIANLGREEAMRDELSAAVGGLLSSITEPDPVDVADRRLILSVAKVVTQLRVAAVTDWHGEVQELHAAEGPGRVAKQLTQVFRGCLALGMNRDTAMALVLRTAVDTMPPRRWAVVSAMLTAEGKIRNEDLSRAVGASRKTVSRIIDVLELAGLVERAAADDDHPWPGYVLSQRLSRTALGMLLAAARVGGFVPV